MAQPTSAALERLLAIAGPWSGKLELEAGDSGVYVRLLQPALSFRHSYVDGRLARRARQSNQALLKACNNKARNIDRVLDLTAGWGSDSLILAAQGQQVAMVERNNLLCAVMACSLEALARDPAGRACARRMTLANAEAGAYLRRLEGAQDFACIYLDPMFPAHKSSAKPAKEMQILQCLTDNREMESVFELALQTAGKRVVVKRPARASSLTAARPDIVYREKTVRFDVYLTAG